MKNKKKDNRLITLLKTFENSKEIQSFEKFLLMYVGERTLDFKLWLFLKGLYHHKNWDDDFEINAINHLYEGDPNKKKALSKLMNRLTGHIKIFFSYLELQNDPILTETLLAKAYKKRKLNNEYEKIIDKKIDKIQQLSLLDSKDNFRLFQLLWDKYHFDLSNGKKINAAYLISASEAIYQVFVIEDTKIQLELLSAESTFNIESLKSKSIVKYYQKIADFLQSPSEDAFKKLKTDIVKAIIEEQIPHKHHERLFTYLLNFAMKKYFSNTSKGTFYVQQSFELYQLGLKQEILLSNNQIPPGHFLNIIAAACHLKQLDWGNNFIEKYKNKLPLDHQQSSVDLAQIMILFNQGLFQEVIYHISKSSDLKNQDVAYFLRTRFYLLRSYYEVGAYNDLLDYHIPNAKQFLKQKRVKLSADIITRNNNLIEVILKLSHFKTKRKKISKTELIKEIKELYPVVSKDWVKAKLNLL